MLFSHWVSRKIGWVALALSVSAFSPGCKRENPATQPTTGPAGAIVIGAIDPLTGPFAAYGEPVRDGMLLAVDEINAAGGINGRPIKLILEDDSGDPKAAVNAFSKLATVDKVPVIIGPLSSGCSMATAPLADRYKVVQLSTLAGTIDLTHAGDYVFRIYPSSEIGSRYIAKIAIDRFKAKRIAILYPNNQLGVTSRKVVTEVVEEAGVPVVDVESYRDTDRDFRTQLTKIREAKPDVLLCSAYYEEGARILVQARELGLNVPVLGEDNWSGPIAPIVGDARKHLYFADVAFDPSGRGDSVTHDFVDAFERRYRRPPNSYAAAGHAAVYVVKHAIEAGGVDSTRIKDALYATDIVTAFGRIRYDSNGDNTGAVYALYQIGEHNERIMIPSAKETIR